LMTLVPFSSLCVSYTREERREQVNLWIKCLHFFPHVSKGTEEQISTSDNNDNGDEENLLGLFFDAKVVDHHASKIVVI